MPSLSTSAYADVNSLFPITYFKLTAQSTMAGVSLYFPPTCAVNYSTSATSVSNAVTRNTTYFGNLNQDYYFAVYPGVVSGCALTITPNGKKHTGE